jgi:hypothetical protein
VPRPDAASPTSLEGAVDWLRKNFDPEAARGVRAVYALELSGMAGGAITACIDDGRLEVRRGSAPRADLRLSLSAADFYAILAGRANADLLFLRERIGWSGDLSLALKMRRLFRGQPEEPRPVRPGA